MFITNRILDLVVTTKDDCYAIALGAKENEIRYLKDSIEELSAQLKYERSRADGLVDRLLVRDARVAAVSPAAIEIAKHKDEQAVSKLKAIFDDMNAMGADIPSKDTRAFDLAGGSAVAR